MNVIAFFENEGIQALWFGLGKEDSKSYYNSTELREFLSKNLTPEQREKFQFFFNDVYEKIDKVIFPLKEI